MRLEYRADIDGLRAVAVLSVILYHAGIRAFGGGYVGVDIFFVISGYLITSIITVETVDNRFSIVRFYERRVRRILPALYVVVASCIPFAWLEMVPEQLSQFGHSIGATVIFASNILFWREAGYFAPASELKPLLHIWSLSLEEQFYMVFPAVFLLLRRFRRRVLIGLMGGAIVISLALTEWAWRHVPGAAFYLLPTRLWELLAGSLCAVIALEHGRTPAPFLSLLGLVCVVVPVLWYDDRIPWPSLFTVVPVAGTCALMLFSGPDTLVGRLLGTRACTSIGVISYSAYLWHQPLFAFARLGMAHAPSSAEMLALSALALAMGGLSWRFIERPFRNPVMVGTRLLVLFVALTSAALLSVSAILWYPAVWEDRWAAGQTPQARAVLAVLAKSTAHPDLRINITPCRFIEEGLTPGIARRLRECRDRHGPGLLVIGDSHGIDLFGELTGQYPGPFLVGIAKGQCRPHHLMRDCQYAAVSHFLRANPGVFHHVVFEQAGFYLLRRNGEAGERDQIASLAMDAPVRDVVPDTAVIAADFAYLRELADHVPVVWYGPRLEPMVTLRALMRAGCAYPYRLRPGQAETYRRLDRTLAERARTLRTVRYVSQIDAVGLQMPRDFLSCDRSFWADTDHYSALGEWTFGQRMPRFWQ